MEHVELFIGGADIDYFKGPVRKADDEPRLLDCAKQLRLLNSVVYLGQEQNGTNLLRRFAALPGGCRNATAVIWRCKSVGGCRRI